MKVVVTVLLSSYLLLFASSNPIFTPDFLPQPPADECGGPEDGIRPLLAELMEIFPTDEFLTLILEALSYDQEVIDALLYLQGPTVGRIIYEVSILDEWHAIVDYLCDPISFHIRFYLKIVGDLFEIRPVPPATTGQSHTREITGREPGVLGLIRNIIEIMPIDEWAVILAPELETNEYLIGLLAKVRGDEVRAVAETIAALSEFDEVKDYLRSIDIELDCVILLMQSLLGWPLNPGQCLQPQLFIIQQTPIAHVH